MTGPASVANGNARARDTAALSERALVAAIRGESHGAVEELIRRYQHLVMSQGRRFGVARDERTAWAAEVLYHVATSIGRRSAPAPRALVPYILQACRHGAMSRRRQLLTRERVERSGVAELGGTGEHAVVAVCSEHSVRSTYGPAWEAPPLPRVIDALAGRLDRVLRADERQLLSWASQHVPYATMAAWLGTSRGAAIKRVTRLRARLVKVALAYGASLDDEAHAQLVAFFRRTRALDARALADRLDAARTRPSDGERRDDTS